MHLEFLVEEPSVEAALTHFLPRVIGSDTSFAIHVYRGKPDLLTKLPARLRGYRSWLPADWRIVVLIDRNGQDCRVLKDRMEETAVGAGLVTKTVAIGAQRFQLVNRLAIEELEAWFFGDVEAMRQAYPKVPATLGMKARYRNPDAIRGGTWEALERVLQKAGYCQGGLPKIEVARTIAEFMDPDRNRSKSFQVFRDTLRRMVND